MKAIASSWSRRCQEKRSSREDTSDSMAPVCTQMKLYGRRPADAEGKHGNAAGTVFRVGPQQNTLDVEHEDPGASSHGEGPGGSV